jgi:hypothetical protein
MKVDPEREPADSLPPAEFGDVSLRTPPNWTAVCFLGMLGGLHLAVALPSAIAGQPAACLGLSCGVLFATLAVVAYRLRSEVAVLVSRRRVRLRTGLWRFRHERWISFDAVRAVRLTLAPGAAHAGSAIELLCHGESIECPPTRIPRQEALFLAMAIDVPLVKVFGEAAPVPTGEGAGTGPRLRGS